MTKKRTRVSIIIPSYNSFKTLGYVISGIQNQSSISLINEIFIIDSSDDVKTKQLLSTFKSNKIKVFHSGKKVIAATQRNIGAKMATGNLLVFLDSDTIPEKNYIKTIVSAYNMGYFAGGGSFSIPEFQLKSRLVNAQYYLICNEYLRHGNERSKKLLPAANLFCDRKLFFDVGGFPEILASEDCLLTLNISKKNILLFIPDAMVYHIFRDNMKDFLNTQFITGKYIFIYRKLYYNSFYLNGLLAFIFVPIIMFIKFIRIYFRIFKSGTHHFIEFNKTLPLVVIGITEWGKGFYNGIKNFKHIHN